MGSIALSARKSAETLADTYLWRRDVGGGGFGNLGSTGTGTLTPLRIIVLREKSGPVRLSDKGADNPDKEEDQVGNAS
jgi:hypothetical protein